jgi:DMSO/TMAO reductase YedYZ molybdopterin-dependent catalytic subunit
MNQTKIKPNYLIKIMKICFVVSLYVLTSLFSYNTVWSQASQKQSSVVVEGEVSKPLTLYQDDLLKLKRTKLNFKDFKGLEYYYSGVALAEILRQAGAIVAPEIQGEDLAKYLLVKSADGSEVIFSLAELDSGLTNQTIILADQMNSKPLPQGTGPFRLVVPGDKKRTRWIWEVNSFVVRYAKEL